MCLCCGHTFPVTTESDLLQNVFFFFYQSVNVKLLCFWFMCFLQEAVISPVSPDVLYLFRVQAVCMNDMRSDFSQSMLFRGNADVSCRHPAGYSSFMRCTQPSTFVQTVPSVSLVSLIPVSQTLIFRLFM